MSLTHSRALLLCRIAEQKELDAQRTLAGAQRQLVSQQRTEDELKNFLGEYEMHPATFATASLLENKHRFLARLRDAIGSQEQQSRTAARQVEDARLKWIGQRKERGVADAMLEQVDAALRLRDERRSQKETDEFSASRHSSILGRR